MLYGGSTGKRRPPVHPSNPTRARLPDLQGRVDAKEKGGRGLLDIGVCSTQRRKPHSQEHPRTLLFRVVRGLPDPDKITRQEGKISRQPKQTARHEAAKRLARPRALFIRFRVDRANREYWLVSVEGFPERVLARYYPKARELHLTGQTRPIKAASDAEALDLARKVAERA